jgi:hypothetical protein
MLKAGGPVAFLLMVMFAYCAIPALNDFFLKHFFIFFAIDNIPTFGSNIKSVIPTLSWVLGICVDLGLI